MIRKKLLEQVNELQNIEEFHSLNETHNYRYERKFTVPDTYSLKTVEHYIKCNKSLFREVFQLRKVNNIYFDTVAYNDGFTSGYKCL